MNAIHAKKAYVTLYIHTHVLTHTYICLCTYMYVCIWKKEMHTACHVGFLCVWGRWFSVKCRALYKVLFFSNKAEMYLLLPLFIWEGKVPWFWQMFCSSLPFGERVMEWGGGEILFLFWRLPEILGWIWSCVTLSRASSAAKNACSGLTSLLRHDLNSFSSECLWILMNNTGKKTRWMWWHGKNTSVYAPAFNLLLQRSFICCKNNEWILDKKKHGQTKYCNFILTLSALCFEQNVIFSVSILSILAAVPETCSLTASDRWAGCKWCGEDHSNWMVKANGYFQ